MSHSIPILTVRLKWTELWAGPPAPHLLRGAVAAAYRDNDLFHQHTAAGKAIYRYPRIHYRWDRGDGLLVGFGEGVEALGQLFAEDLELRLGDRAMVVREALLSFGRHPVEVLPRLQRYRFRSPWLALNQQNLETYTRMRADQRPAELDRIAVGNILSALKGLGVRLQAQVYAAVFIRRRLTCVYKDQRLAGFLGTLATNVCLPPGLALGKAVSHGYGWIERLHPAGCGAAPRDGAAVSRLDR